ncbi:serine/threonine-protein kinase [Herbidospora mongoliensis]|uniref:serine/threonine-protein kinase n=1 Tax=Herbidospora mongoliensis TaxID=688067 RepID=UPI000B24452B|nr:serine/threonine-protein kinase [Herbidospora mongoliensis]
MANEPQQIGPYRITGRLGRGGMGTVYLGQDDAGRKVAVKVINAEYSQNENFRVRFRREADSAQRVRRFCTAAVLAADLDGEQLYVVTEYVDGPNLEQAVEKSGPLTGSSLEALAVGVATALTAIHSAGIVHRDLKPSNVLLSNVGPRVIDFGIARALDTFGGVTHTGELVGTPRYMAPEVLRGEAISPACDVFSWGCLVAFAASGKAPFNGEALPAVIFQVLNAEPVLDNLEPQMRQLVLAALDKDPGKRPTAQQLLDSMVGRVTPEIAQHTVAQTWKQSAPTLRQRTPNRGRLIAGVAVAAAVAITAGIIGVRALAGPSGPPEHLSRLYLEDFTSNGDWSGTYDPDNGSVYGYTPQGTYALDLNTENPEGIIPAPIPFVAVQKADPGPSPTPVTPLNLLISVFAEAKEPVGTGEYGLFCRGSDNNYKANRYEFLLNSSGEARIRRVSGGSGGIIAKGAVDLPSGKNSLTVSCEPGADKTVTLTMWVNGNQVATAIDNNGLATGDVGIIGRVQADGESSIKLAFDDFELRGQING